MMLRWENLGVTVFLGTLEKYVGVKIASAVMEPWQSLTFVGMRLRVTFARPISADFASIDFAAPGLIVADVAVGKDGEVEALLVADEAAAQNTGDDNHG